MLRFTVLSLFFFYYSLLFCQENTQGNSSKLNALVSVDAEGIPLDAVFEQLSNQTGCFFTYNADQINGERIISATFNNVSLANALDTLLENPTFTYELINNQVIIHPIAIASIEKAIEKNEGKTIKGVVIGANDNVPLPFASIVVKNTYYGAISNNNGEFSIKIPEKFLADTLEFSFIGYHTKALPIEDVTGNISVKLETGNVSLQEVIVRSVDPFFLLAKARKSLKENYYSKPYNYEAFYREAVKKGSKYRVYSEALLYGFKPSFLTGSTNNRVQIIKARKYNNIRKSDTLLVKLQGGMEGCFRLDLVHELPDFLQEQEIEIYDYNLNDITVWNNELVYVISFKQKEFITEPLFEGELYITVDKHTILGAEFSFAKKMLRKTKNLFVVKKNRQLRIRPLSTQYKVQYAKWNGKYFTKHVRGELTFKAKKSRQLIHENYTTLMEMVYTQIDTVDVIKPERKLTFRTHSVFSESDEVYNDFYWKETNIINPEADILQALKSSGFKVRQEAILKE